MDNERVAKELVRIAKELTGKGSASKKYVKDVERMSKGAITTGKTLSGNLNGVSRALAGGDPSAISDEIDNALSGFENEINHLEQDVSRLKRIKDEVKKA